MSRPDPIIIRHCEEQSDAAIQKPQGNIIRVISGLPRRFAPRNDGARKEMGKVTFFIFKNCPKNVSHSIIQK